MEQRISRRKWKRRRKILRRFAEMSALCVILLFSNVAAKGIYSFISGGKIEGAGAEAEYAGMGSMEDMEKTDEADVKELAKKLEGEGYPESLLELMTKHPETKQFVLHYWENRDKEMNIDLSGEVEKGIIPLFLQWDERWGYQTYGDDFMAVTGCGPACLAMVRCGLAGDTDWDPLKVARMADAQGYYVQGAGSAWDLMMSGAEQIGLMAYQVSFDENSILSELRAGNPIICVLGPGEFTTTGHFIVLAGADENGNVAIRDPNSRLNSEKTWRIDELMSQIRNLWGYYLQ